MKVIKQLQDILAKTKKNMNNRNRKNAVEALEALFIETNDPEQVASYIMEFHYSVCQAFFKEFCLSAADKDIIAVAEALTNQKRFKKGNPNNFMYPKGFAGIYALLTKKKYQPAHSILVPILSRSEKSDGFSNACARNFKKVIADKGGLPLVIDLFEQVMNGSIVCDEIGQQRFARFVKVMDKKIATTKKEEGLSRLNGDPQKQPFSKPELPRNIYIEPVEPGPKLTLNYDGAETMKNIEKTQQDILASMHRLIDNQSSIDSLSVSLAKRDDEINSLRNVVLEKKNHIASLESGAVIRDKQLLETKEQIDDLTHRLRTSLQMDNISKNQELITLKKDIAEALKLDHADYAKSIDSPYSEDMFIAYRLMINRIFKLLKKFGITIE